MHTVATTVQKILSQNREQLTTLIDYAAFLEMDFRARDNKVFSCSTGRSMRLKLLINIKITSINEYMSLLQKGLR